MKKDPKTLVAIKIKSSENTRQALGAFILFFLLGLGLTIFAGVQIKLCWGVDDTKTWQECLRRSPYAGKN